MIEKNIRLQPHHARDLLVGRRSDGRRPGYQPPGGGATSMGSGRDVGGGGGRNGGHDRGGGQHAAQAAAAQAAAAQAAAAQAAAAQQAAAQRAMQETIAQAEKAEANRVAQSAAEGKVDVGFQEALKKTEDIRQREQEFLDTGDYDVFADTRLQPGPKVDVKDIMGEVTDPGSVSYDPTYKTPAEIRTLSQDPNYGQFFRQPPVTEKPKSGIMSAIGGGLKKIGKTIFGDNPLEWALNIASMGGYKGAKYAKALYNLKKNKGVTSKAYKKAKSILDTIAARKKTEEKLVKDKDGIATQIAKGTGLEKGYEMLGIYPRDDINPELKKLMAKGKSYSETDIIPSKYQSANLAKFASSDAEKAWADLEKQEAGIEVPVREGEITNRMLNKQLDELGIDRMEVQNEIEKRQSEYEWDGSGDYQWELDKIAFFTKKEYVDKHKQGQAHGGRIDRPLTGRSRYI